MHLQFGAIKQHMLQQHRQQHTSSSPNNGPIEVKDQGIYSDSRLKAINQQSRHWLATNPQAVDLSRPPLIYSDHNYFHVHAY